MSLPRLLRRVTPRPPVPIERGVEVYADPPTIAPHDPDPKMPDFFLSKPTGDTVTIARATHEHRNARLRDLEAQVAAAHARIIDLDHQCAEQLATIDAQDQTIRRAIRDLSASLQENQ